MCPKATIKNNDQVFIGDDPLRKMCPKATIKNIDRLNIDEIFLKSTTEINCHLGFPKLRHPTKL